jgi:CMP-N,N'-diacetyllegionaminic acid synthase
MKKKVLAIIPARGGSKRLPGKNIIDFCGQPMISYVIQALQSSNMVDKIIVSSDYDDILSVAKKYQADISKRPAELATDDAKSFDVIRHELSQVSDDSYDYVLLSQPTSPLLQAAAVKEAIDKIIVHNFDSLISVVRVQIHPEFYFSSDDGHKLKQFGDLNSGKASQKLYQPNGALYIYERKFFQSVRSGWPFSKDNSGYIEMSSRDSADIDTQEDLDQAKYIYQKFYANN